MPGMDFFGKGWEFWLGVGVVSGEKDLGMEFAGQTTFRPPIKMQGEHGYIMLNQLFSQPESLLTPILKHIFTSFFLIRQENKYRV